MATSRSTHGKRGIDRSVSVPIWAVGFLGLVLVALTLAQILTLGRLGQVEATAKEASQSADTASSLSSEVNALAQTVADNEPVPGPQGPRGPQGERGPRGAVGQQGPPGQPADDKWPLGCMFPGTQEIFTLDSQYDNIGSHMTVVTC